MLEIRKISERDIESLVHISYKTFVETFGSSNTQENMDRYLDEHVNSDQLKSELADSNSEFYFAEIDQNPVGYFKINFGEAQTEIKENEGMEIERIYVLRDFQKQFIGQQLFNQAIAIAKERNCTYVWLGVWEKNTKAIKFYQKNGLKVFDTHFFVLGEDKQTDLMMKLEF